MFKKKKTTEIRHEKAPLSDENSLRLQKRVQITQNNNCEINDYLRLQEA